MIRLLGLGTLGVALAAVAQAMGLTTAEFFVSAAAGVATWEAVS